MSCSVQIIISYTAVFLFSHGFMKMTYFNGMLNLYKECDFFKQSLWINIIVGLDEKSTEFHLLFEKVNNLFYVV